MGMLLSARFFLVFVCLTFGAEVEIVMESEPWIKEELKMTQIAEKLSENPCISKKTCTDCIRAHPDCAWCAKQDMDYTVGGKKRCNYAKIIKDECGARDTIDISQRSMINKRGEYDIYLKPNTANGIGILTRYWHVFPYVLFTADKAPENVQITHYMSCSEDEPEEETNYCRNVQKGDRVDMSARIELLSCPENRDKWNQTIRFYKLHREHELLFTVNLHMLCECDCEKPWNLERNSPKCSNGRGTYHCGICSCYGNRYGEECECEGKTTGGTDDDDKACIAPHDTKICSGRGRCRCGICECFNKTSVTGSFCECDSSSCARSEDGQICGGEDHGKCVCGKCECTDEWTGPACDCKKDIEPCRSPYNKLICHGLGECKCGQCQCFEKDRKLRTGRFCEDCTTCPLQCEKYRSCVRCRDFHRRPTVYGRMP